MTLSLSSADLLESKESVTAVHDRFRENGFVGPIRILNSRKCRHLARALDAQAAALSWPKGRAPHSRLLYELATARGILDIVEELIGPNIALWGASTVVRRAGQVHAWHTDIETAHTDGRAVSVWIGLENTGPRSSLNLISRSHSLGTTIQQVAAEENGHFDRLGPDALEKWARAHDPQCRTVNLEMTDGMAVFFDGRLWHGSDNRNRVLTRTAVLLQYVTPDCMIRIPDFSNLDWPFTYHNTPRPPCIMVRGTNTDMVNEFVPPPSRSNAGGTLITKFVRELDMPLDRDVKKGWRPHPIFAGHTRVLDRLTCHVSILEPGHTPHPPHDHEDEELLITLAGEANLVSVDNVRESTVSRSVRRGHVAYYPSGFTHTISNASEAPVTYLMFKWRGRRRDSGDALDPTFFRADEAEAAPGRGLKSRLLFEGPTRFLRKLHCHTSSVASGDGYPPHVDAHDVAIVVLKGTIETMGTTVGPNGVVFFGAGEPHDMKNVGDDPCHYVVFEFHGEGMLTDLGWKHAAARGLGLAKRFARRVGLIPLLRRLRSLAA